MWLKFIAWLIKRGWVLLQLQFNGIYVSHEIREIFTGKIQFLCPLFFLRHSLSQTVWSGVSVDFYQLLFEPTWILITIQNKLSNFRESASPFYFFVIQVMCEHEKKGERSGNISWKPSNFHDGDNTKGVFMIILNLPRRDRILLNKNLSEKL